MDLGDAFPESDVRRFSGQCWDELEETEVGFQARAEDAFERFVDGIHVACLHRLGVERLTPDLVEDLLGDLSDVRREASILFDESLWPIRVSLQFRGSMPA